MNTPKLHYGNFSAVLRRITGGNTTSYATDLRQVPVAERSLYALVVQYGVAGAAAPISSRVAFFGTEAQVAKVKTLIHNYPTPWHDLEAVEVQVPPGSIVEITCECMTAGDVPSSLIAQVNATFALWMMHSPGVWHTQLADIFGVPTIKGKSIPALFGKPVHESVARTI